MFSIRIAIIEDIELIQALAREIWITHYTGILSADQIEYMLNLMYSENTVREEIKNGVLWQLITLDEIPKGFLSLTTSVNKLKLNKLYLLPGYHGHGFGQMALAHVVDYAESHNISEIHLTVNKKNYKAIKAYEKAGFTKSGSQVTDIGNGYVMDDFKYSRFL